MDRGSSDARQGGFLEAGGRPDAGVDYFRDGGGIPYSAVPRFQALQAEESAQIHDAGLVEITLPLVDGLVERLRDRIDVIDVGCGHGHAANLIADAFHASRVTGIEISEQGLAAAQAEAARLRLSNVRFELRDALSLEPPSYDLVTAFDVSHDLPRRPTRSQRSTRLSVRAASS